MSAKLDIYNGYLKQFKDQKEPVYFDTNDCREFKNNSESLNRCDGRILQQCHYIYRNKDGRILEYGTTTSGTKWIGFVFESYDHWIKYRKPMSLNQYFEH